ncbi:MAG: glutathione synthase [Gammaproteobacteria bacterium]|nr:glutathione synthase [Gammaproteobacteria bacterium]
MTDNTGGARALGVVMDDIGGIHPAKDTTLGLLEAAQRRNWRLFYVEQRGLFLHNGNACAHAREVRVSLDNERWHEFTGAARDMELASLDAVLMRKDPPLDMEYFYTCQILEHAARAGVVVVNRPRGICTVNEKILAQEFPGAFPETLVSRDARRLAAFVERHRDTVVKPLDNMGGASVFRVRSDDVNASTLLETMTRDSTRTVMLQALIPQYRDGDKRILVIGGRPVPKTIRRVPAAGELRANIAAGGSAEVAELEPGDVRLCERIAPRLNELQLLFVGLDVIGGRLTEINVTSPTCARELERATGLDITGQVIEAIEGKVEAARKNHGK